MPNYAARYEFVRGLEEEEMKMENYKKIISLKTQ